MSCWAVPGKTQLSRDATLRRRCFGLPAQGQDDPRPGFCQPGCGFRAGPTTPVVRPVTQGSLSMSLCRAHRYPPGRQPLNRWSSCGTSSAWHRPNTGASTSNASRAGPLQEVSIWRTESVRELDTPELLDTRVCGAQQCDSSCGQLLVADRSCFRRHCIAFAGVFIWIESSIRQVAAASQHMIIARPQRRLRAGSALARLPRLRRQLHGVQEPGDSRDLRASAAHRIPSVKSGEPGHVPAQHPACRRGPCAHPQARRSNRPRPFWLLQRLRQTPLDLTLDRGCFRSSWSIRRWRTTCWTTRRTAASSCTCTLKPTPSRCSAAAEGMHVAPLRAK